MARKRIGELLRESGAIDDRQLQGALQYQRDHGGRIGAALVARGALTEEQLVKVLGQTLGIPVVDIPEAVDPMALKMVKVQFAEDHDVFPLHLDENRSTSRRILTLAVADPLDLPMLEEIEFITGCRIQPVLATPSQIRVAILRHYHRQNIDQQRHGGLMTVVRPGGDEEVIDTSEHEAIALKRAALAKYPSFGSEDEVVSLTEEVTSRTELAEMIKERERARHRADPNLRFLTGESDSERLDLLERKFWALMRILAKRGVITKDDFLKEFDR